MNNSIFVAMSGAEQTMIAQTIHAHNLANVSTTGFKADLQNFESKGIAGEENDTQIYAAVQGSESNFAPGMITTTGRELDVAIDGDGWIAIQSPTGKEAYTRAGDFRFNQAGQLVTGAGHPVLGNGGPIAIPPAAKIEIGGDGTITIRGLGQGPEALSQVDRIKLVNPDNNELFKDKDGLFYMKNDQKAPVDATVKVVSGALEKSNVNAVEELISLISLARQYEMQVKTMKNIEEIETTSAQIMQLN